MRKKKQSKGAIVKSCNACKMDLIRLWLHACVATYNWHSEARNNNNNLQPSLTIAQHCVHNNRLIILFHDRANNPSRQRNALCLYVSEKIHTDSKMLLLRPENLHLFSLHTSFLPHTAHTQSKTTSYAFSSFALPEFGMSNCGLISVSLFH